MANETTSTSVTELISSEWISPYIQSYAEQYRNPIQFFAKFAPTNSSVVSVPRWVSDQGSPNDDGAGVDTEYDISESSDLTPTELETTDSSFSVAMYGIQRTVTDVVIEDSFLNAEALMTHIATDGASTLTAAANDDACALFAGFTQSSGSSGSDLTVATVDDALYDLAERNAAGELVGIFDNEAVRNFLMDLQSTGSNVAVYGGTADRMMDVHLSPDQGRNVEGWVLRYKNCDIYRNGLTDTANTGADVVSCIFVRGDIETQRDRAALGQAHRREFRIEAERDASYGGGAWEINMTMRWGCGKLRDDMGQKIISDAP